MKWTLVNRELKYQGFFKVELCHVRHETFAGEELEVQRELFERGDAVAVLLYDADKDRVVLIEQFRIGATREGDNPWLLEIVAGVIEDNESIKGVARRECREEAGVEVHSFEPVHSFYSSPGGCSEKIHVLCALVDSDKCNGLHGLEEEGEDIRVMTVNYSEIHDLILSGRINSAIPLVALQWLQLNRRRLQTESFVL